MDYLKHYNLLIKRAINRDLECYTESHHIIPRCMGGTDEQDNLVNLTPEEHYLAHQLLVKIYPENARLSYAANMMCTNRPSNKLYGWIRKRISENMKTNNPNKTGLSNRKRKGKYNISDIAKQNISNGLKSNRVNVGEKNGLYKVKPWDHPRATKASISMWARADKYYEWWIKSGLSSGQNPMAKAFNEKYTGTHANLVKYFKEGWVPYNDKEWNQKFKI
jgi:hypothetical protein